MLASVVLVRIHNQRGDDSGLHKSYKVIGYPTFVLASRTGETLYRWWGYSKDEFMDEISKGLADPTTITEKQARYISNPDLKTAAALATYHFTRGDYKKSVDYYSDAAKYDPDYDYTYEIYSACRGGFRKEMYSKEEVKEAADKALASEQVSTYHKLRIYDQLAQAILLFKDDPDILTYIREGYAYAGDKDEENIKYYKTRIKIAYTLYIEKDIPKAVNLKKNSFEAGWQDNAGNLNSFAWWCFENHINLEEAETLGRRGIKLAEPGRQRGNIMDTVAEICNLRGDTEEAIALMKNALKEVPDNEYYTKQLNKFRGFAQKE